MLKKLFLFLNLMVIAGYLLTCLLPFVNTETLWFIAILGLGFPILFTALAGFTVLWLIFRSRWWIVSFIVLLLGFKQITSAFALNIPSVFSAEKKESVLRVVHWNLSNWDNQDEHGGGGYRMKMLELIEKQNADVLCFQEFYEQDGNPAQSNIRYLQQIGFRYYYFVPSSEYEGNKKSGNAIFSRFPIVDTHKISFTGEERGEHLVRADIQADGHTFRFMTIHLQSVRFEGSDYDNFNSIKKGKNPKLEGSRTLLSKLKTGYENRYEQALLVRSQINESPYPVILTGDFNDVPNSSTYFKIKGDMQDVFLKRGFFLGRTFRFLFPTLRIDYILADKSFTVKQYMRLKVPYSDHYGLVSDLRYVP